MFHSKRTVSPVFSYKVPNFSGSRHFHQPYHHFLFNDTKQKPPAAPVHTENRGTGSSLCIYRRTAKSPQADIRLRAKTLLSQQSLHRRGISRNCQQHRAPLLPQDRILQLRDLPGTVVPVVLDLTLKIGLQSALGGLGGAAHQSWSANIFSTIGDMFPKSAIASVTGIGGMAGGVGSMILQWFAGWLFVYADETAMQFMGFEGKPAGYFVVFCICAVAYLIGWIVMKTLVPKYKPIVLD